jgi:hypothetical protein
MNTIKRLARRSAHALTAVAFTLGLLAPVLISESAYAAGQFSSRKLTMSSSASGSISTDANGNAVAAGAGGNGAKAKHTYDFLIGTAGAVQSLLIQYCTTPLLDTTCTAPTGMDASTVASIAAQSGGGATAFTLDTTTSVTSGGYFATYPCASRAHCITLQRTGGASISAAQAINLAFGTGGGTDWIKNPTSAGTFYVRIYTFSNNTYTLANMIDEAAVAGSVSPTIDITAKVQEKLNFSVSATWVAPTAACTALSGSGAIPLGDPTNGVLDIATAYDAHSYFRLNTNAQNGTAVYYSGDTLKNAALTNTITALTSETLSIPGTAQFGLAFDSGDVNYSLTNLTRDTGYDEGNGNINPTIAAKFNFATGSVTTPVQIASASAGTTVACDTGSIRYIGNIATTTKAGIYRTSIAYIAVPTF